MPGNHTKTDVVIVGAGLIGTSAALSLKNQVHRIDLLETHLLISSQTVTLQVSKAAFMAKSGSPLGTNS